METTPVNILPNVGNIADADKLVGERVDGTTALITFNGVLYDADFATNGFMSRTAAATYANRTLTGTASRLSITNGNGVSGNPIFDIDSSYVGQSSITTLGTIGTGTWNASIVGMTYGGSGANLTPSNGGMIYSTGTTMAVLSGTATANKMLLSGSSTTPSWSTSTIPSSAGATANKVLLSDGTNYVLSTPTFPNAASTSGKRVKSDGTNLVMSTTTMPDSGTTGKFIVGDGTNYVESTSTLPTSAGATANKVLLSDGTNYVLSTPTFPNASATSRKITVSDGTNWVASTETYAVPGSAGNLLRSDGTNWTAAKATLTTDVTGVLPVANGGTNASSASITAFNNITGYSAAGSTGTTSTNLVFSTSPTLVTPTLGAASATSITFTSTSEHIGTTTNNSAAAGSVGEFVTSAVTTQAITSNTFTNVTSISLTAGDWDVWGSIHTNPAGTTTQTAESVGINTTSATLPAMYSTAPAFGAGVGCGMVAPNIRLSLSGTTTVYLVASIVYSVSTLTIDGTLSARRRR